MVYWNQQYFQSEASPLFPASRALLYGDGFFETFVYHHNRIATWPLHWERMCLASAALGFDLGTSDYWSNRLLHILPADTPTLRVRLSLWRTGPGLYTPESDNFDWCLEWKALDIPWLQEGTAVHKADVYPFPMLNPGPWSGFKTLSSMPYVMAGRYQKARGLDAVVLLDQDQRPAEALGYNLFCWDGQTLKTPPLSTGIVNGTFRRLLLQSSLGLPVVEQHLTQAELCETSELWLTNVTFGIRTVDEYCGRKLGNSGLAREIQWRIARELEIL